MKQKIKNIIPYVIFGTFITFFLLYSAGTFVSATGLFDETIDTSNFYSKYGLENYQLDFYVDSGWSWLPWTWTDSLGKTITYGFYAITNLVWILNLYICNATGYVIQEAFKLDFVNIIADEVGKGLQSIAGVSVTGMQSDGLIGAFLPWIILAMGAYIVYVGMLKRETTKSFKAVLNFFLVLLITAGFTMYAPTYIKYINGFGSDVGTTVLSVSSKVNLSNQTSNKDSVDLIRDNLFTVQVYKPWLILQYGNADIDSIGQKRIDKLLSTNPNANKGEDREKIVKEEIEEKDNGYLTVTKVYIRFAMVFFLLALNIGISIFVLFLSAIKIFTQVQFIIYTLLIAPAGIISMIPNSKNMLNKSFLKLFNTLMLNAGIIMVITIGFTISNLIYNITDELPFFMVMFLQIVIFAGIYMRLSDILDMVSLKVGDGQSAVRKFIQNPARKMKRMNKRMQRKIGKISSSSLASSKQKTTSKKEDKYVRPYTTSKTNERENIMNDIEDVKENAQQVATGTTLKSNQKSSDLRDNVTYKSQKLGEKVGAITGIKSATKDKVDTVIDNVKNMPTNVKYGIHQKKRDIKDSVKQSVSSFKDGMNEAKQKKVQVRENVAYQRKNEMQQKQDVLQKEKERKQRIQNRQKARQLKEQAGVKEQVIKPIYTVGEDGKIQSYINKVYAKDGVKDKIKQKRLSKTQYRNQQNVKQPKAESIQSQNVQSNLKVKQDDVKRDSIVQSVQEIKPRIQQEQSKIVTARKEVEKPIIQSKKNNVSEDRKKEVEQLKHRSLDKISMNRQATLSKMKSKKEEVVDKSIRGNKK